MFPPDFLPAVRYWIYGGDIGKLLALCEEILGSCEVIKVGRVRKKDLRLYPKFPRPGRVSRNDTNTQRGISAGHQEAGHTSRPSIRQPKRKRPAKRSAPQEKVRAQPSPVRENTKTAERAVCDLFPVSPRPEADVPRPRPQDGTSEGDSVFSMQSPPARKRTRAARTSRVGSDLSTFYL